MQGIMLMTLMLLLLLLLLLMDCCLMQQSGTDGQALGSTNSWMYPNYPNRKLSKPSFLPPPRSTERVLPTIASYKIGLMNSAEQNSHQSVLKEGSEALGINSSYASSSTSTSSTRNALKNLTQLIQYLRYNRDYSMEDRERPSSRSNNSKNQEPRTNRAKKERLNGEELLNPISSLLDQVKRFCDLVKNIVQSQAIKSGLEDLKIKLNGNKPNWMLASDELSDDKSAEIRSSSRPMSSVSIGQAQAKEGTKSTITSSLLAPISVPALAVFDAAKSILSFEEDEGRHKHKKVKKKLRKFLMPLLLAYKLKFLTLIPLLMGGLVLLVSTTGMAGFFFALFAAVMSLRSTRAFHRY